MDMNRINGFSGGPGIQHSRPAGEPQILNQQNLPQISDKVDFADGANNPVELMLIPSLDMIVGQSVVDAVEKGKTVKVEGQVTTDNGQKKLAQVEYEMKPDSSDGSLHTQGYFLADAEKGKGTFIKEKSQKNPMNPAFLNIQGNVSTDKESQQLNSLLNVSTQPGMMMTAGQVNGFPVQQQMGLDYTGSINMQGNIAGTPFMRRAMPNYMTGGTTIQGQMGNMPEYGTSSMMPDGGILIDRQIGPYRITQKLTFQSPPPPPPPPENKA